MGVRNVSYQVNSVRSQPVSLCTFLCQCKAADPVHRSIPSNLHRFLLAKTSITITLKYIY